MKRYWARFSAAGDLTVFVQGSIGPHFFTNAKEAGDRVAIVTVTEMAMTADEAALANACPTCGRPRRVHSAGAERAD